MKELNAIMVTDSGRFNERSLYEIEGIDNSKYFSGGVRGLTIESVVVKPATVELLKGELGKLGLKIEDSSTIKKVATRYPTELASLKNGKLALHDEQENRFYEIIRIIGKVKR